MSAGAPAARTDAEAQRKELLRELEQHRQRIDEVLSPRRSAVSRLQGMGGSGFPRSHTMRLILSEPALTAALSALAAKLLGRKGASALPLAASVARTVRDILLAGRPEAAQEKRSGAARPNSP